MISRFERRFAGGSALHQTIQWLYGLQHFGIKLGLDNIRALLDLLGRPERAYRTVHVAGTNGKGSVAAMIDAMLTASGVRSGLFTSPHLVRPNERMRIAGDDIGDDELHRRLAGMRTIIDRGTAAGRLDVHPSFFEVVTATALQAFADHELAAAVLEVGLGGRLDATNAVDADVGVIVSIALDHTKSLGDTVAQIAGEKAGIVKPGMPLVSGVVQQSALDVVRAVCRERGAELIDARLGAELVAESDDGFTLRTRRGRYPALRPALLGRHQVDNARIALVAFEHIAARLGFEPHPDAVRRGLAELRWPGRLQWIDPVDGGPRLLVDGAHNPAGLRTLAAFLGQLPPARIVLLFGATRGKPLGRMLGPLAPWIEHAVITQPSVDRAIEAELVAAAAATCIASTEVLPAAPAALRRAREVAGPEGLVLVTGSLYLVGDVLALLSGAPAPGPVAM